RSLGVPITRPVTGWTIEQRSDVGVTMLNCSQRRVALRWLLANKRTTYTHATDDKEQYHLGVVEMIVPSYEQVDLRSLSLSLSHTHTHTHTIMSRMTTHSTFYVFVYSIR
ncbi:hypothetical protein GOP47_0029712, partial [Adiantum capillus-veneris]